MPIQICKHVCKILFSFKDIKILIFTKFLNLEFEPMHLDILIDPCSKKRIRFASMGPIGHIFFFPTLVDLYTKMYRIGPDQNLSR